jgi:hypothetical protein
MTGSQLAQLASALLSVATPLLVAAIVLRVARAHAKSVGLDLATPRSFSGLRRVTALTALPAGVAAATLASPSPWMFLVGGLGFAIPAIGGWRVLSDIDRASLPARELSSPSRTATLTPRHANDYLPWTWRVLPYGLTLGGIIAFVIRATTPLPHRQLLVPAVFAFASTMFVLLYETWIQHVATGPAVSEETHDRTRLVRRIFLAETALVITTLGVAHAVLDLNWSTHDTLAATLCLVGGAAGIAGCALALASGLIGRKYQPAPRT